LASVNTELFELKTWELLAESGSGGYHRESEYFIRKAYGKII